MGFKDVDNSRWSARSIARVFKNGLMSGYPDGTFKPERGLSREEMASILDRLIFQNGLFNDILPSVMPSVVLVHRGDALGSGACIAKKNGFSFIITNAHVVGDKAKGVCVKDDGTPNFDWELVTKDANLDLAIVKTKRELPVLEISTDIELGEPVAVIGAPIGLTESVSVGIISSLKRDTWIQLDAPINPGNSGGPVINEKGQLVAIVVAKIVDPAIEGIGFAIRPEIVKDFVAKV